MMAGLLLIGVVAAAVLIIASGLWVAVGLVKAITRGSGTDSADD